MISFIEQQSVSLIAFVFFLVLQIYYFVTTRRSVSACQKIFPGKQAYKVSINDEGRPLIDEIAKADDFNTIREQTNAYLRENKEAVDLAELKDIADRYSDAKYGEATSHISIPMYLGLMGTYVGVAIGLVMLLIVTPKEAQIAIGKIIASQDAQSQQIIGQEALFKFIGGVVVAMMTSFCGLILTTINNRLAARVEEKLNSEKEGYFHFLQTKVFPSTPSTIVQTFQNSVLGLQTTVERLSTDLAKTFSGITRDFGQNLRESLGQIAATVVALQDSAAAFRDSMSTQREIVEKMVSNKFIAALKQIDNTVDKCAQVGANLDKSNDRITETIDLQDKVAETQRAIVTTQSSIDSMLVQLRNDIEEYQKDFKNRRETEAAESQERFRRDLENTSRLFKDVEEVLNRFKTFEEHVNRFAEAEVGMNTGVLERIDAQIKRIESVRTNVDAYLNTNSEELHSYLDANKELIYREVDKFKKDWGEFFFKMNPDNMVKPESFLEKLSSLDEKLSALEQRLETITSLIPPQSNHSEMLLHLESLQRSLEKRGFPASSPASHSYEITQPPVPRHIAPGKHSHSVQPADVRQKEHVVNQNGDSTVKPEEEHKEAPRKVGLLRRLFGR